MKIQQFNVGWGMTNCYLVSCNETNIGIMIDAHFREGEGEKILEIIDKNKIELKYLVNTHGHFDHITGNSFILENTKANLMYHKGDKVMISEPWLRYIKNPQCPQCLNKTLNLEISKDSRRAKITCNKCHYTREFESNIPSHYLEEGDIITFGNQKLKVIHTPGHSKGCICLHSEKEAILFSGDTLFRRSIGRTDFSGANNKAMKNSLRRLKQLPLETRVYPGHGDPTTIDEEKMNIESWIISL